MQHLSENSFPLFRFFLLAAFLLGLLGVDYAHAESRPGDVNPQQYIGSLGQLTFSQGGGAFLPGSVLQSMRSGQISPIMQFVLLTNMMNQSVKKSLSLVPDIRHPYVVAKAKFDYGICVIKKAFEEGMVIAMLPKLSNNRDYGGYNDPAEQQANQQQALAMAQAFQKDASCSDGADSGFDPMILSLIQR